MRSVLLALAIALFSPLPGALAQDDGEIILEETGEVEEVPEDPEAGQEVPEGDEPEELTADEPGVSDTDEKFFQGDKGTAPPNPTTATQKQLPRAGETPKAQAAPIPGVMPRLSEAPDAATLEEFRENNGVQKIPHPMAEKGLMRITRDKVYRYKIKSTPQTRAASVRFGMFDPTNLANDDIAFADVYDQSSAPMLLFDYEWQWIRSSFGKIGLKAGSGLYVTNGKGRFEDTQEPALEGFTFLNLPNSIGGVYRMQFWDRQPLVPYAEGGATAFTFAELRDDGATPKVGGSLAAHFAVGVALQLNFLDPDSMASLDREQGINFVYLTVEARTYQAITKKFDFTGDLIAAGVLVEF